MAVDWETKRQDVVYLLKSGEKPEAIACKLGCSPRWVYKCQARYQQEGWDGLKSHSRAPHRHPTALEPEVKEAIRTARRELELEAQEPERLSYIGARAVQGRLHEKGVQPLPSASSIEREIRRAGLSRPRRSGQPEVTYPQLQPTQAHQLIQVDIYPRLLPGGQSVACFNALDVVSRYPTGWQSLTKTAQDAAEFLVQVWQEVGLSHYTQVDNESCFSGGFTHPYVLGRVVRLALAVGTELVFSPFYHPESNGTVERFHQDYDAHTWAKTHFTAVDMLRHFSKRFFQNYRRSRHHSALQGRSPTQLHLTQPFRRLAANFEIPDPLPLTAGRVHFIRQVDANRQIKVLNVTWEVPLAQPQQGVWATLELTPKQARLIVYDTAPDAPVRKRLACHPFPLKEKVLSPNSMARKQAPAHFFDWLASAYSAFRAFCTMS
jgi:transposase InsO family protein